MRQAVLGQLHVHVPGSEVWLLPHITLKVNPE